MTMMKQWINILSILMTCFCWACTNEDILTDDIKGGEDIVIRFDISSRAESNVESSSGTEITNLKVWMVENGGTKAVFYKEYDTPAFDDNGIFTLTETVYIPQEGKFNFYVLANSSCLSTDSSLNGEMDVTSLERASFNDVIGSSNAQRDIPMFGKYQSLYIPLTQQQYEVEIPITRMLAKVETFFAKTSSGFDLTINKIDLQHIPNKGYVAPQLDLANKIDTYVGNKELSSTRATVTSISKDLDDNSLQGFQAYVLNEPFVFENPYGCHGNEASLTQGDERGYQMNISYTVDGTVYEQAVYLPKVERNTIYKVYCLVDEKGVLTELELVSQPWQVEAENWEYTETVTVREEGIIKWTNGTCNIRNEAEVYMIYATIAECVFTIDTPVGGMWYASLVPVSGNYDAFAFEGEASGEVGKPAKLRIRTMQDDVTENSKAELQIVVRTIDGRTIVVNNLLGESSTKTRYTLVQSK